MSEVIEATATEELAAAAEAIAATPDIEEIAAEAPAVEAPAKEAPAESMEDYQNELNSSMRTLKVGDIVDGTVAGISDTDVTERISGIPSAVSVSVSHATEGTDGTRTLVIRGA